MNYITKPYFDLAFDHLEALCRLWRTTPETPPERLAAWWRSAQENQARFVRRSSENSLALLEMGRTLFTGHLEKVTRDTEAIASELAHTTTRAVAIATQARRDQRDRRVFHISWPSANERRATSLHDRRSGAVGQRPQA